MKYHSVMDLHTHTVASGHAYCTLREMAKAASDKGLELLGITEHAPKMPGTCHKFYFQNIKVVPREMYGIQLLLGSEVKHSGCGRNCRSGAENTGKAGCGDRKFSRSLYPSGQQGRGYRSLS